MSAESSKPQSISPALNRNFNYPIADGTITPAFGPYYNQEINPLFLAKM